MTSKLWMKKKCGKKSYPSESLSLSEGIFRVQQLKFNYASFLESAFKIGFVSNWMREEGSLHMKHYSRCQMCAVFLIIIPLERNGRFKIVPEMVTEWMVINLICSMYLCFNPISVISESVASLKHCSWSVVNHRRTWIISF